MRLSASEKTWSRISKESTVTGIEGQTGSKGERERKKLREDEEEEVEETWKVKMKNIISTKQLR